MIKLTEAIKTRHSVRQYLNKAIDADTLGALQTEIAACNKEGKLQLIVKGISEKHNKKYQIT